MSREDRLQIIEEISNRRNSEVICYFTGDRKNISTRIAPDAVKVIYQHLRQINPDNKIDLFIYTRGGDVLTPWRLVNLIREYCDYFSVLVPFRAYSAGTLICLGANEIVMGKMGELGPIDPTVANAFNPQNPNNPEAKIPISVEDVSAYLDLAQERFKVQSEDNLINALSYLVDQVHPLALGNVRRNYLLIRSTAKKLLSLHSLVENEAVVQNIIDYLTEKLYAHNYMIPRKEAADIKLPVKYPDPELEDLLWRLYENYEEELELKKPFQPLDYLDHANNEFQVCGGYIESKPALDKFIFTGQVQQDEMMNEPEVNITEQKWVPAIK
ncbi:SDH family Clp fold serine proteinase [Acetohalobium arabaticum]|uniref:Serine dehydrogenase proteinase n=1 Tax=Acetohalobium arabaticum (strain ATCC 49924 / DSM 5501 / Z-7288) TaxID=574087 RepID=D9QQK0_ACEAZ|nr:hypothetical protein [Acetohalobium arabaticum]ADL12791.1 protein of unknown function DUF114 [Acetohalobium arabaticum DSM 5501]